MVENCVENQLGHNWLLHLRMQVQRSQSTVHRQNENRSTERQVFNVESPEREKPWEPTDSETISLYVERNTRRLGGNDLDLVFI